jgi:Mn2+/Fe2+ NRAMP family transporter
VVFARVHSDELRIDASNFADALASRETEPGIEREVRRTARHAGSHRGRAEATPRASGRPCSWCGNRTDARAVGRRLFVSKVFGLALGILAAVGGFVDIGDLVFNVSAGAMFGYELLWVIPVGVVGIIVFSEMCGRVAAVSKKAVFDAVRERVGFKAALGTLIASEVVNLMTFAAELGGVAIALQLLSGLPYRWLIVLAALGLGVMIWVTSFDWIERIFGYGGLCLLVFAVAAVKMSPDWGEAGAGLVPHVPQSNAMVYAYFVVGLLGAAMTPYEVYFYSSGAVEEEWTPKDLGLNRANAIIGYGLGGFFSIALMLTGATLFLGRGIEPEHVGTIALGAEVPLGEIGLVLAIVGSCSPLAVHRSTRSSRVPTTSHSSAAGSGAAIGRTRGRPGSR